MSMYLQETYKNQDKSSLQQQLLFYWRCVSICDGVKMVLAMEIELDTLVVTYLVSCEVMSNE
jgi:hypothetical protein